MKKMTTVLEWRWAENWSDEMVAGDNGGGSGHDHTMGHNSDEDTKKEECQDPGREWGK